MNISGAKLKNTAFILLEIFVIECCNVSMATYDVATSLIYIIQPDPGCSCNLSMKSGINSVNSF